MQDNETMLANTCADLVSLKKTESFPFFLFGRRPGEWTAVRDFCLSIGVAPGQVGPGVFVTWLPDPLGNEGYNVIVFYDDESKWSMAAHYNRARLCGGSNQVPRSAIAALTSSDSTSGQPTPATES